MNRLPLFLLYFLFQIPAWSQGIAGELATAFKTFQSDSQLQNGIASLYVLNAKTGQVVFEANGQVGLAPASTQKIITSITAYELLGHDFTYTTKLAYQKKGNQTTLVILPSGDPTLGSWRWNTTQESFILKNTTKAIQKTGIKVFNSVVIDNSGWNEENIPNGWIWQDIGNYYGAGAAKLNWHENQFDVYLRSGKNIGGPVQIISYNPQLAGYSLRSELSSAAAGTGDNAYIYFPLTGTTGVIRGTIPVNQSNFKISGAMPDAAHQFINILADTLSKINIKIAIKASVLNKANSVTQPVTAFHTIYSPPLDSIIYWFNKKSINLYGETLLKTLAFKSKNISSPDTGTAVIRRFWKNKGIAVTELNMVDGSGLSPMNRVTTHAQARILQYAGKQPWFNGFYNSLPLYNGMKMKSGTIKGTKGFCGYHTSKAGQEYVFAFLVNNYNGPAGTLVQKMYKVLDVLK